MTHSVQNVRVHRGNSLILEVQIQDQDGTEVDMTGSSVKYQVAEDYDSSPLIDITDGSEISISGSSIMVTLSSVDTDLTPGDYIHEMRVVDSTNRTYTALTGTFSVDRVLI